METSLSRGDYVEVRASGLEFIKPYLVGPEEAQERAKAGDIGLFNQIFVASSSSDRQYLMRLLKLDFKNQTAHFAGVHETNHISCLREQKLLEPEVLDLDKLSAHSDFEAAKALVEKKAPKMTEKGQTMYYPMVRNYNITDPVYHQGVPISLEYYNGNFVYTFEYEMDSTGYKNTHISLDSRVFATLRDFLDHDMLRMKARFSHAGVDLTDGHLKTIKEEILDARKAEPAQDQ